MVGHITCGARVSKDPKHHCFEWGLILAFISLLVLGILRHEMWRDELHAWLIGRDSASIFDLMKNRTYEAHPALWFLLLYLVTRFTHNPFAMQLVHLSIATGAVSLLVFFSPFTRFQKVLLAFGYFMFYEYAVISRNYSLGVLLLFVFCVLYARREHIIYLACVLFALTQTNAFCLIIAIGLALFSCITLLHRYERSAFRANTAACIIATFIVLLGCAISIMQINIPADGCNRSDWLFSYDRARATVIIGRIWTAYVPLPRFRYSFWGTNCVRDARWQCLLGMPLFVFFLGAFARRPAIAFLYAVLSVGILLFLYGQFEGYVRHFGHLFIVLIVCAWLYEDENRKSDVHASGRSKLLTVGLTSLLVVQVIAGAYAYGMDIAYPFSAGKEAARFMKARGMDEMQIIGDIDYSIPSVIGYFDVKVFYPRGNRYGSFEIWDKKRTMNVNAKHVLAKAEELLDRDNRDVVIIMNYPELDTIAAHTQMKHAFKKVAEYKNSIVPDEAFCLYLLTRDSSPPQR